MSSRTPNAMFWFFGVLLLFANIFTASECYKPQNSLFLRLSTSDLHDRQILEQKLRQAAFRQFSGHKTGIAYPLQVPDFPSGIYQAVRLRSGSLRRYGITLNEFSIPRGCLVKPTPQRIMLVYGRLSNTTLFHSLPEGFRLASNVLLLFAYNATAIKSTVPVEAVNVSPTKLPITIHVDGSSSVMCAAFDDNSTSVTYSNINGTSCEVEHLGAFALVTNSSALAQSPSPTTVASPSPSPQPIKTVPPQSPSHLPLASMTPQPGSNRWKIAVASVVGGVALLAFAAFLGLGCGKRRRKSKLVRMEYIADQGETLQTTNIKHSRVPAAADTRTLPTLESDYTV